MRFHGLRARRKARSLRRGMALVEATLALATLSILGLILLKLSLNILYPRQWALQQTLSDAYLTYERAYAQRISFEQLTADGSPWPFQNTQTVQVEIGRLPGNVPVNATVVRTRFNDTPATNPAAMQIWRLQSVLTYEIGGRQYIKSRSVTRSQ